MTDARIRESYRDAATAIAACLVLGACSEDKPERAIPTLDAEYAGCAAVYAGPVCTLTTDARELVFWAEVPRGTAFRVRAGDDALAAAQEFIEGGVQVRATIPANATEVVLERMENNEVSSAFKLPIRPDDTPPEITEALALRGEGKFDEAEAKVTPLLESDDELVKTRARSTLARIELRRGHHQRATAIFDETSRDFFRLGALSASTNDVFALASTRTREQWDFAGAIAALEEARQSVAAVPEARVAASYYEAQAARYLGDSRRTISLLEDCERHATRLSLNHYTIQAAPLRADTLQRMGRDEDADEVLESVRSIAMGLGPCERADYSTYVGWTRLMRHEARGSSWRRVRAAASPVSARETLEAALRDYLAGCPTQENLANAHLNLALEALHRSDVSGAQEHVAHATENGAQSNATLGAWLILIRARIARALGDDQQAVANYRELLAKATAADAPLETWRGHIELAQLFERTNRLEEAVHELEAAESQIDELTRRLAVNHNPDGFAGDRDISARRLVSLLLASGNAERAWRVARHARSRALRAAQRAQSINRIGASQSPHWSEAVARYWRARSDIESRAHEVWVLPTDRVADAAEQRVRERQEVSDLLDEALALVEERRAEDAIARPARGVLWVAYFPTEVDWVAFAVSETEVFFERLSDVDPHASPDQLAARLLEPFSESIREADEVRFLTYAELDLVDFGNLPWSEGTLLRTKRVTYGVDHGGQPANPSRASRRVLIVADGSEDLPAASGEASDVAAMLRARGYIVESRAGADATRGAVTAAIQQSEVFHYAGHGDLPGLDPSDATLRLAAGTSLSVADILVLPHGPNEVVLAACHGGTSHDGSTGVPGLTIARAFVASGAEYVVAASGPIGDEDAARFSEAYYRARAQHPPTEAFRLAMLGQRGHVPYRLYVP